MIKPITSGALVASTIAALCGTLPAGPAAACNRMDGCIHDAQLESYGMMHDGRMAAAMRSGAASVDQFKAMQGASQQPASLPAQPSRRPRHR